MAWNEQTGGLSAGIEWMRYKDMKVERTGKKHTSNSVTHPEKLFLNVRDEKESCLMQKV